jgi:hypothetical protein
MICNAKNPPIHLWVYNNPLHGISDQIEFIFMIMREHGYKITMSRHPREDALNLVVENFSEATSGTLIEFCKNHGKRVALVMTEHLDLMGYQLFIHGDPLWSKNDYMHPATQVARIKNMMDCIPYLRAILVLGDLPELIGADVMFPGVPVRTLPFPKIDFIDVSKKEAKTDFVFSGVLTDFRKDILKKIQLNYSVDHPNYFLTRKERDRLYETAKIILNVPQRDGWRWLSLMRVMAALRCGRATISIGTNDSSAISCCCIQLSESEWERQISGLLADWRNVYRNSYDQYETMRLKFVNQRRFPTDLFQYWASIETISCI